jgi:hypothetical protein
MSRSVLRLGLAAVTVALALVLAAVAGAAPEGEKGKPADPPGQQKQTEPQGGPQSQGNGKSSDAPGQQKREQSQDGAQEQGKGDGRGANQPGPYDPSGVGEPSGNGRSESNNGKRPCAGCVGKADDKNPPGQLPGGSDRNRGYECDQNQGVGKTNPAHSGCGAKPGGQPPLGPPREEGQPPTGGPPREEGRPSGGPPALVPPSGAELPAGAVLGAQEERGDQPGPTVESVEGGQVREAPPSEERGKAAFLRSVGRLPFTGLELPIFVALGLLALAGGLGVRRLVRGRLQG